MIHHRSWTTADHCFGGSATCRAPPWHASEIALRHCQTTPSSGHAGGNEPFKRRSNLSSCRSCRKAYPGVPPLRSTTFDSSFQQTQLSNYHYRNEWGMSVSKNGVALPCERGCDHSYSMTLLLHFTVLTLTWMEFWQQKHLFQLPCRQNWPISAQDLTHISKLWNS